jgi:ParB-like chromosome segregation protein Spo0J
VPVPVLLPPNASDVKKIVEDRLAALEAQPGLKQTVTIEWRGAPLTIPVISMPIGLMSYNPATHRIRAQRTLDPERDRELTDDPYGTAAQAYLHQLLMGDPADPTKVDPSFEALKDDLAKHSQAEPGIATREGVLINGNTRRAALKQIGQDNIRVGVVPPDASRDDLDSIELSLQLRKEHKRDYSFMNFLLAVDERVEAGWQAAKIQQEFRIRASTFERARWILAAVREVIDRSKVAGTDGETASLRIVDFETHQGKLEELYRAYMARKRTSPDDAEALREQRLMAIVLDKSKTDVRLIEPDFADRYMKSVVPASDGASVTPPVTIPGLSITAAAPSPAVTSLRALTDQVLKARAMVGNRVAVTPSEMKGASETLQSVGEALERGLTQAGKSSRVLKTRLAAVDRLSDAIDDLRETLSAIADARATGNFDPDDLDDALLSMKEHLTKLAQLAARDPSKTSEGLVWLRAVASLPDGSNS